MQLKPKILIATDSFLPRWDGITRFLVDIVPCLTNKFDITIVCPKFQDEFKFHEKVKIIRLPIVKQKKYFSKVNLKPLNKLIKDSDIVWVHSLGPIGISSINNAEKIKKHLLFSMHYLYWELVSKNRLLEPLIEWFILSKTKKLYKKCSVLIVPSIHTAKILESHNIKSPKVIVKTGVDTEKFVPAINKENSKEFIGIEKTRKVIGYVGRLTKEKDIKTLYDAFKKLEKRYNNLFLLIIGKGDKKLEKLLKKEENIRIIKSTNNIIPYLQAMDIFVMPSHTETSSIATLEAMSCGLPVITTKIGDLSKYIKDKENGLFFSKKNEVLLSLKIEWLLKEDFVRKSLGLNANETIKNVFKLEQTKENIKRILESF
jgi:glycosyltransferase involved in cell wall biosynthesis